MQRSCQIGMEFIREFWQVLPHALQISISNGDQSLRNAVLRLIKIWNERKILIRGCWETLKVDLLSRCNYQSCISYNLKLYTKNKLRCMLLHDKNVDKKEYDSLFRESEAAISSINKIGQEMGTDFNSENIKESGVAGELQKHQGHLRAAIKQLKVAEICWKELVLFFQDAVHEQELKLKQIQNQLMVSERRAKHVDRLLKDRTTPSPPFSPPPPTPPIPSSPPPSPPPHSAYSEAPPLPRYFPAQSTPAPAVPAPIMHNAPQQQQQPQGGGGVGGSLLSNVASQQLNTGAPSHMRAQLLLGGPLTHNDFTFQSTNKKPRLNIVDPVPYNPQPQLYHHHHHSRTQLRCIKHHHHSRIPHWCIKCHNHHKCFLHLNSNLCNLLHRTTIYHHQSRCLWVVAYG